MDVNGQINHKATARTRFPHMSHHEVDTGKNMVSWNTYNQSYSWNADQQCIGQPSHKTSFYEDEYQKMVSSIDKKLIYADNFETADPFGELVHLSLLADEKRHGAQLGSVDSPPSTIPSPPKRKLISLKRLLKWKRYQDEKHELFMSMMRKLEMQDIKRFEHLQRLRKQRKMSSAHGEFKKHLRDSSIPEQWEARMSNSSEGDSSISSLPNWDFTRSSRLEEDDSVGGTQDANARKGRAHCGDFITETEWDFMLRDSRPSRTLETEPLDIKKQKVKKNATKTTKMSVCRHFTKGWCRQGEECTFEHSEEGSHPDSQKVFLGGLPTTITPAKLLLELSQQGYNVINQPTIFRRFSPQVCLSSTVEAMKMLQKEKILICGCMVDVRPYKASTKKERDRQLDTNKRSVFLSGLPSSVNLKILKAKLKNLGMKMTNRPRIQAGFTPKVTLASVKEAEELIARGTIRINEAVISVRAYISEN